MKIQFYEIESEEKKAYQQAFAQNTLTFFTTPLTENTLPKNTDAEIISVFVCSAITETILKKFPNLKLIVTRSTGMDHIDLEAAKKLNIKVYNLPQYADVTVAEFTFALILMLSRKLKQAIEHTHHLDFSFESLRGFDLSGKTIGIVGMGNIGKQVARIAQGFGMKTLAFDVKKDMQCVKEFDVCYVELDQLLAQSDIITLHVPLNAATYHLINSDSIKTIKKGAILINTARGPVVDTQALIYALQHGILAGAGLDVLQHECETKNLDQLVGYKEASKHTLKTVLCNCWLSQQPNVIITPHTAFNTHDALMRRIDETIECIKQNLKEL